MRRVALAVMAFLLCQVFLFAEEPPASDPKDLEGILSLARWCQGKGLQREASERFRQALDLAPGNAEALAGLGYVQEQGVWMTQDEAHQLRGDRRYKGRWLAVAVYRRVRTGDLLEAKDWKGLLTEPADLDIDTLAEALKSRSPELRSAAVAALGAAQDARGVPPLVTLLVSREGAGHEEGIQKALLAIHDGRTPQLLLQKVVQWREGQDEDIQSRLVRAVGALGDKRTAQVLSTLAVYATRYPLRHESALALARLQFKPAFDALCKLAVQGDSLQRARAGEALLAYGSLDAVPFLITALDLRQQEIRGVLSLPPAPRLSIPGGSIGEGGFSDEDAYAIAGIVPQKPKIQFDQELPERAFLEKLTGQNLGEDVDRWKAWWEARKK